MATIISNQASASYTFDGSNEIFTTTSNVANTTLLDDFSLEVKQINYQTTFKPGENLTYSIIIKNTGIKEVKDLTINIETSPFVQYKQNSARLFYNDSAIEILPTTENPLAFFIPNTIPPSSWLTLTYITTVNSNILDSFTTLNNNVVVTSDSFPSGQNISFTNTESTPLTRTLTAELIMSKQVSRTTIQSSENYDYIITLENTGLADATNVIISDALPSGFKVNSITVDADNSINTYSDSQYDISPDNVLTLPNLNGSPIIVKASTNTDSNRTIITINGTYLI